MGPDANPDKDLITACAYAEYLDMKAKLEVAAEALNWEIIHSIDPATRVNCEQALSKIQELK